MKYCIGIDIGGTFIKFGVLDENRRPGETVQLETPDGRDADGIVRQVVVGVDRLMETMGLSKTDVVGVGIGAPGPVAISEGMIAAMPNFPEIRDYPIRDRVAEALGLPAVLENDANAAALGEFYCGAGKSTSDMILLTLGTGVGGGIILGGRILHGAHEFAGELGHIIVEPSGRECGCGQTGCLEQYASATYIAMWARRRIERDAPDSSLTQTLRRNGEITSRDIVEARKAGDAFARDVWDEAMYYLAIGCVSLCRVFDPDMIVLAGGMTKAGDDLLAPLLEHVADLNWKMADMKTRIDIATLGNDAGVIGAAGVAWQRFGT